MEHSHLSNRLPFRQLKSFLQLLFKIHFTSQTQNRDGKVRHLYFANSEWNCAEGKIPWENQFSGWLENTLTWFVMLSFWFLSLNCFWIYEHWTIFFAMHFIWPRPAPHKCQGESKQPPCHCYSKLCLWNCFDAWPGTQALLYSFSQSIYIYGRRGLIIRSSWKNSSKTTLANAVLWHISACLRRIRSARTLLLCGQRLAQDNRVFVMKKERDKTLGASAPGRLWPQPSRLSGAESCEGHSWGSLSCVFKIKVGGFFVGRAWYQKLKLQVLA